MIHVAAVPDLADMVDFKTLRNGPLIVLPYRPMHHDPPIIESGLSIPVNSHRSDPNVTASLLVDDDLFQEFVDRIAMLLPCAFAATKASCGKF
jgi:hypothetical protein